MMNATSERLSELMKEKGISCRQLSEMTGIKKSSVNNYANGTSPIPIDKLQLMASALGVSAAWLIGWADNRDGSMNKPETVTYELSSSEAKLVNIYRDLNADGKNSLMQQAQMHSTSPAFRQDMSSEMA